MESDSGGIGWCFFMQNMCFDRKAVEKAAFFCLHALTQSKTLYNIKHIFVVLLRRFGRMKVMNMNKFIKTCRINAGLTQEKLAEKMGVSTVSVQNWESGKTKIETHRYMNLAAVFNIPVETLIKEMIMEEDQKRPDQWPGFLFDDDTNAIIDTLHLNLAQQDLFGLLYIYDAEYLKKTMIDYNTLYADLKKIPYGFIEKVGSIQFMNQMDGLHKVIKYIQTDFLMKVLKINPETEFNVKRLPKDLICEFIDEGAKTADDMADYWDDPENYETEDGLQLRISMHKARTILPVLEEREIYLTDGNYANPPREKIPEEILLMCGFKIDLWKDGYYGSKNNCAYIRSGLEIVTDCYCEQNTGKEDVWVLKINEKGRKLQEWFREKG